MIATCMLHHVALNQMRKSVTTMCLGVVTLGITSICRLAKTDKRTIVKPETKIAVQLLRLYMVMYIALYVG